MGEVQNALLPADAVVCSTIRNVRGRREYAVASQVRQLYGGSVHRATARLRGLRSRGLVESHRHGSYLIWWLTPAGDELADTVPPACLKCCAPVEPDLDDLWNDLCRLCLADLADRNARMSENMAASSRRNAEEYEAKAEMRRARAETLRRGGGVLLFEEEF